MSAATVRDLPTIGAATTFRKTVTEADVAIFAGITGDLAPQHIDDEYMQTHPAGRRIAHGSLVLALTSTAAARLCEQEQVTAVSYGYERVRFIRPVYLGDTVSIDYRIEAVDPEARKAFAQMRATTRRGEELVLVGTHILYCYPDAAPAEAAR